MMITGDHPLTAQVLAEDLSIVDVPLTPLQILWMNLATDGFPALAVEPAEPNGMNCPPHDPQERIFAQGLGAYIFASTLCLA